MSRQIFDHVLTYIVFALLLFGLGVGLGYCQVQTISAHQPEMAWASEGETHEVKARFILRAVGWPDAAIDDAVCIAWQESRFEHDTIGDGGRSLGPFQIYAWIWRNGEPLNGIPAFDTRRAFDWFYSAWYALQIWEVHEFRPWSTRGMCM